MVTNQQSGTNIFEIAPSIYRINTPVAIPGGPDQFNFRFEESARAFIACEGEYSIPFDKMREFIDPGHRDDFDRFVAAAKAAETKQFP